MVGITFFPDKKLTPIYVSFYNLGYNFITVRHFRFNNYHQLRKFKHLYKENSGTIISVTCNLGYLSTMRLVGMRSAVWLTAVKNMYEKSVFMRTVMRLPFNDCGCSQHCSPTDGQKGSCYTHYVVYQFVVDRH